MTKSAKSALKTKTTPTQPLAIKNHIYTMAAAFAGVVFGVLGSMGFVGNYLNSQFAAQTAALDKRLVAVAPAAATGSDACYGTSTASTSGATAAKAHEVAMADHEMMPGGRGADGSNGGNGGSTTPFVSQLVNGSISNTGPNSNASINATNNFNYSQTNNNNVSVSNNNSQSASSGSATTSNNTNGGSANTGDSSNTNTSTTVIGIDN